MNDLSDPGPPPFLGVRRSLNGRRWAARLDAAGEGRATAIGQRLGVPELLARVAAGRGQTAETCDAFLAPSLRDSLPDPDVLRDVGPAVDRLARAVEGRERVAIFGDYDVDGACSAALLGDFLRAAGLDPVVHIPDRVTEGYGPNVPAVTALARAGATLLVTVDCGTAGAEPLAHARALGLDCVVVDHHGAPAELPEAVAIVNPNRQDDLSGLGHLCAAGVTFLVLVALNRALRARGFWADRPAPDLLEGLDLVALATVADVVPLTGLNRAFLAKGLAVTRLRRRPGLAALFDVAGAGGPPTAFHLGFLVGPRINAGGRIGDAALGARLLVTRDAGEARAIAERLDGLNRERRAIEGEALAEAEAALLSRPDAAADRAVLVLSGAGWHPGVVGLVAARLRERHERPAFAIAQAEGGIGTGSGRSVPGVDLGRAVRVAVERGLLLKGGGHAMAAGITVEVARIEAFRDFLHDHASEAVARHRRGATLALDGTLSAAGATQAALDAVERAGPFGSGNPEPVFAFPRHRLLSVRAVGADHLRLALAGPDGTRLGAVAFRAASGPLGAALRGAEGRLLHVAGHLSANHWGSRVSVDLRVVDAAVPDGS